jgi:hypothetical protein
MSWIESLPPWYFVAEFFPFLEKYNNKYILLSILIFFSLIFLLFFDVSC